MQTDFKDFQNSLGPTPNLPRANMDNPLPDLMHIATIIVTQMCAGYFPLAPFFQFENIYMYTTDKQLLFLYGIHREFQVFQEILQRDYCL